jgi:hypothetical protein
MSLLNQVCLAASGRYRLAQFPFKRRKQTVHDPDSAGDSPQGVCFRAETKDQATAMGLTGWCHNHPDSSVEGVAYGPTEKIKEL